MSENDLIASLCGACLGLSLVIAIMLSTESRAPAISRRRWRVANIYGPSGTLFAACTLWPSNRMRHLACSQSDFGADVIDIHTGEIIATKHLPGLEAEVRRYRLHEAAQKALTEAAR